MNDTNNLYNPNHFTELITLLDDLSSLVIKHSDKKYSSEINRYISFVKSEIRDLDVIWQRFLKTREESINVDIETFERNKNEDFEKYKHLFDQSVKLNAHLKSDIKSLFLFSDILFSKFILLIRAVTKKTRDVKYSSFSDYLKSIRILQNTKSFDETLYSKYGEDLEKIDVLLGFFRDKFIVHINQAYQEGLRKSVYYPEINIDYYSFKLSEFDYEKFFEFLKQIKDLLPDKDKFGNPLFVKSDPRLKVEVIFYNLHKIKDHSLKDLAEGFIRSVGINTPDIYYLVENVKISIQNMIEYIEEYLKTELVVANT